MADAEELIGALVVVGIAYVDLDGSERLHEVAGVVASIVEDLIEICRTDGSTFTLPPAPEAFQPAEPGAVYTLHSTGEQVNSPAFWASFNVNPPHADHEE